MGLDALIQGNIRPPQGLFQQSVQQKADLGYQLPFADGRVYKYAKAGSGALVAGQLVQAPTVDKAEDNDIHVQTAGKAIDRELKVTIAAAHGSFVANAYESGFLIIESGDGLGTARKIKSNDAFTNGADATITFKFKDALGLAVATTDRVSIIACPYRGVIDNVAVATVASFTGRLVGAAPIIVTGAYYFWLQVRGIGPGLRSGNTTLNPGTMLTCNGIYVLTSVATAGCPVIGHAASHGLNVADHVLVYYTIE